MTLGALLLDLDDTLIVEWESVRAAWSAIARRVWGPDAGFGSDPDPDSGAGSGSGSGSGSGPAPADTLREAGRAVWRAGVAEGYRRRMDFSLSEALYGAFVDPGPEGDALRAFVPRLRATAFDAVLPAAWQGRSPELVDEWVATWMGAQASFPETIEVLEAWHGRVPIVLVTNGATRVQHAKLERTGLADGIFDAVVVGEDVGAGKPAAAPFAAALRAAGACAGEAVMVGNSERNDMLGARALGIRAIHLRRDLAPDECGPEEITDLRQLDGLLGA